MTHISIPSGAEWILVSLLVGLLFFVPVVFYLITLQSTFKSISKENRRMHPGYVWLLHIPLFGLVWHFIVVIKLSDSIQAEADRKNISISEARPAYNIGLAMCILSCIVWIPVIKAFAAFALIICWVVFWVRINDYKNRLIMGR